MTAEDLAFSTSILERCEGVQRAQTEVAGAARGIFAAASINASFDELTIWSFDTTDSLESIETRVAVPEPSAGILQLAALWILALLGSSASPSRTRC